jgi:hypothetical protein
MLLTRLAGLRNSVLAVSFLSIEGGTMRRIPRYRPSPALVIACIALTIALGGTGYAAIILPANSVGTVQLKRNAVNSAKVKNFSLLRRDFKRGQLPAGPRGLTGATGATGATGPQGPGFVAQGFITAAGAVSWAKPAGLTSTWNAGSNQYEITIPGESYFFSSYATVVTPATCDCIARTDSVGGKLVVSFITSGGLAVQTSAGFAFHVSKP